MRAEGGVVAVDDGVRDEGGGRRKSDKEEKLSRFAPPTDVGKKGSIEEKNFVSGTI